MNEPPCISSIVIFLSLAFTDISVNSTASSRMFFLSASLITGTRSPRSVSTATPMLQYFL